MADPFSLAGLRVVVTRPREQAAKFVRRLEALCAQAFVLPAIAIEPPPDWSAVDRQLAQLDEYDWLLFTSANGVNGFFGRLITLSRSLPPNVRIGAIGPGTAAALQQFHRLPDLVPSTHR